MAENPLLPHAELRRLHTFLMQCLTLDRSAARRTIAARRTQGASPFKPLGAREALLAGTLLQVQPGDLLVTEAGDTTASALARAGSHAGSQAQPTSHLPELPRSASRLLLAASMAAALRSTGEERLVLVYGRAGVTDPAWETALTWAQTHKMPLVLACADPRGHVAFTDDAPAREGALTWAGIARLGAKLQLPVLSVDGEDAVAVYRVMQEAALRARAGGGPAVLWAMLPRARELRNPRPRAQQPLGRLKRYLRTRKIAL